MWCRKQKKKTNHHAIIELFTNPKSVHARPNVFRIALSDWNSVENAGISVILDKSETLQFRCVALLCLALLC